MKPKRSDPIYKEIESFEDYELTQCVAYEMAIRSPEEMATVEGIPNYYQEHKNEIQEAKKLGYPDYFLNEHYFTLVDLLGTVATLPLGWEPGEIRPLVLEIEGEYRDKRLEGIYQVLDEIKEEPPPKSGPEMKELSRVIRGMGAGLEGLLTAPSDKPHVELREEIRGNGYKIIQWAIAPNTGKRHEQTEGLIGASLAVTSFKRPLIRVFKSFRRGPIMTIDLNRPLDELLAYVEHVKTDIERKKEQLRSPIEMLGGELDKADDLSQLCTETKNGKRICFDSRSGPTRTQKLADMFFIYDALQSGMKSLKIRTEISEYYQQMGKTTEMSENTFLKYRHIAKDYIEKERYWELITGTKL